MDLSVERKGPSLAATNDRADDDCFEASNGGEGKQPQPFPVERIGFNGWPATLGNKLARMECLYSAWQAARD